MLVTNREEKERELEMENWKPTSTTNFHLIAGMEKMQERRWRGRVGRGLWRDVILKIDSGDVGIIQVSSASTEDLELRDLKAGYSKAVEAWS